MTDGTLWCWGSGLNGELGDGTATNRDAPVQVVSLGAAVAEVSASQQLHTCARKTDGTLWCWGRNGYGELGDGTTTERHSPVQVASLGDTVAEVSAGFGDTCARKTDGTLWCWGYNASDLGDGATTSHSLPVQVTSLGAAVAEISAGYQDVCARKTDGTLWCWGVSTSNTPIQITSLGDAVAEISTEDGYVCARKTDNILWCLGLHSPYSSLPSLISGCSGDGSGSGKSGDGVGVDGGGDIDAATGDAGGAGADGGGTGGGAGGASAACPPPTSEIPKPAAAIFGGDWTADGKTDSFGRCHVAYTDSNDINTLYYAVRETDGVWSIPEVAEATEAWVGIPLVLALDGGGNPSVVFPDWNAGMELLEASRGSGPSNPWIWGMSTLLKATEVGGARGISPVSFSLDPWTLIVRVSGGTYDGNVKVERTDTGWKFTPIP